MKRMKKSTAYMLALMLAGVIGTTGLASAFMPGIADTEQRTAIRQAIENNDFEAWKAAITTTLTKENFDKLVERQKAMSERMQLKNALRQAIQDKDYQAYKQTAEQFMNSQKILTEEEFNAMAEQGVPFMGWHHGMGFGMHGIAG